MDKRQIASAAFFIAATIFAPYALDGATWAIIGTQIITGLALIFNVRLVNIPKMPVVVAGVLALGIGATACNPHAIAWRGAAGVRDAATMTDRAIGAAAKAKHEDCIKKHAAKTPAYAGCIKGSKAYKALRAWRDVAVPTINSALLATITALQIAAKVKDKKIDWMALLRPAVCAFVRIIGQWGDYMGKAKGPVMAVVAGLKAGVCK